MSLPKWILVCLLPLATPALAQETGQPRYNLVTIQAQAQREVQNDLLNATLYVEVSDSSSTVVANAVNKAVNEALRVAKEYKNVRVRSGGNRTYPVYSSRSNQLQGWRGRGEIRIESKDFEAASILIGKLQSSMQLGGIQFMVSPETRRALEDELTVEAIAAFKARADVVRNALGGRGYKIARLNIGGGYAPVQQYAAARSMSSSAEVTPPSLEGGMSQVTISANGSVEVLDK